MGQFIIDNNIISSYFSGTLSNKATAFLSDVIDLIPNISVITEIEALSWVNPDKNKEAIVKAFIEDANIFHLTPEVAAQSVKIRRSRKMKTPDAIIAATAITHNLTLVTSDTDFLNVQGLKVINPKDF